MAIRLPASKVSLVIRVAASAAVLGGCQKDNKQMPEESSLRQEVARLNAKVEYLSDREKIHDTYLRYMRGFDRNDVELLRSAFWPDVQINYGDGQSDTFDEFIIHDLKQHTATLKTWGHLLTNETVDVDGNVAHVESYVTRLASRRSDGKADIISGRYIDRLERRNGEWRIAVREFIPHFYAEVDKGFDTVDWSHWSKSPCGMGTSDKRDPSYIRPLTRREDKQGGPACAK